MTSFPLGQPGIFGAGASGAVDRSEDLRDPARLRRQWPSARVISVAPGPQLRVVTTAQGTALAARAATGSAPRPGMIFLGRADGTDFWAECESPDADGDWQSLRRLAVVASARDVAMAVTAAALVTWHDRERFCGRCGRPLAPAPDGHSRRCDEGHEEFPRVDPAVIVLVHDGVDHAVLGRQPNWPAGRFSVLAGFVEAGESLEDAVRREIGEEVGVPVDHIDYLGSQPWPFPRSLMVAFAAQCPAHAVLMPRPGEIDDARWFSRAELAELVRDDDRPDGADPRGAVAGDAAITLPGSASIARRMIEAFIAAS